jgi:acyl dehydratase
MQARPYCELTVGEEFGDIATVTEWHLTTGSALFYDAGPNHLNPEHSATNRFGSQIAPGFLTTGIMMGVVGRYFGWSIEAFLEARVKFVAPVFLNDNINMLWKVEQLEPKEAFGGGIATLRGWCWSGKPERLAVDMEAKLAVNNKRAPALHPPPRDAG